MTDEQYAELREELLTSDVNPSWSGYSSLSDMLCYFCSGEHEGEEKWGDDVVMDRLMDIIKRHVENGG